MKIPILPDTSLCAIVRDEVMNPAGGIVDFIESTMPFVEAGVIVDTGSIDGTRELLKEMEGKYPNLKVVYDHKFDGYASSRNVSLTKVQTKRALVLDADERLTQDDFEKLNGIIKEKGEGYAAFNFDFVEVGENQDNPFGGFNPRLFKVTKKFEYKARWGLFEHLHKGEYLVELDDLATWIPVQIKHFISNRAGWDAKMREWYDRIRRNIAHRKPAIFDIAQSECPNFKMWKAYNPRREEYR